MSSSAGLNSGLNKTFFVRLPIYLSLASATLAKVSIGVLPGTICTFVCGRRRATHSSIDKDLNFSFVKSKGFG